MSRIPLALLAGACGMILIGSDASPLAQSPRPWTNQVRFSDVTSAAGIRFRHNSGAFGKKYLPETMGSGAAFLDVDNDGWQDLFLVNSTHWPGRKGAPSLPALYRNNGNGNFQRHHPAGWSRLRDVRPRRHGR